MDSKLTKFHAKDIFCIKLCKNLQNCVVEFLDFPEILGLCLINKNFADLCFKKQIGKETVKLLSKKYLKRNHGIWSSIFCNRYSNKHNCWIEIINWRQLNQLYKMILIQEKNINPESFQTYLAYFIAKKYFIERFKNCMSFYNLETNRSLTEGIEDSESTKEKILLASNIMNIFEKMEKFNIFQYVQNLKIINKFNFHEDNLFLSTLLKLCYKNLLNIEICNINLDSQHLKYIINIINTNNLLNKIELCKNKIGNDSVSLNLLESLVKNQSLKEIKLDDNLFSSNSLPLIQKIHEISSSTSTNNFLNFSIINNMFCENDIKEIISNFQAKKSQLLISYSSFFHYSFNNEIELCINSIYDGNSLINSSFEGITSLNIEDLKYSENRFFLEFLDAIFLQQNFKSLKLNLNNSLHLLHRCIDKLKEIKLEILELYGNGIYSHLVLAKLKEIKYVKTLRLTRIEYNSDWSKKLIECLTNDFAENIILTDVHDISSHFNDFSEFKKLSILLSNHKNIKILSKKSPKTNHTALFNVK